MDELIKLPWEKILENTGNWPEHFGHENGNYHCKCTTCGVGFLGHKRCTTCRDCYYANMPLDKQ